MEKLTTVLAVALQPASAELVLDKAVAIARCFQARVEVLMNDAGAAHEITARCAAANYLDVSVNGLLPVAAHTRLLVGLSARHHTGLDSDNTLVAAAYAGGGLTFGIARDFGDGYTVQPLLRAQLVDGGGLAAGQVAMAIPVKPESAVGGRLRQGDRVRVQLVRTDARRGFIDFAAVPPRP